MENATNALYIAAGVLVGILILTLGVSLYMSLGGFVSDKQAQIDENVINQFNADFLKYDKRTDLTIQDVITARNRALEVNQAYSNYNISSTVANENSYYVDVFFKRESSSKPIFNKNLTDLLNKYIDVKDIKCTVTISPKTARVYKLVFE
ncbi:MAG: hypothetical protein HFJ48_04535 [Clostridia bacterium]|nr:hypothetical protein [Clostridia bacterium]